MYDENGQSSFAPRQLKNTIGRYGPAFSGYGQQDSQEFLLFLLDGLQEDLNKILKKPYIEKPDSTDEMMHNRAALTEFAEKCWDIYKARNDSVITDLFAGMYKSTLHCPVCDKFSIIFDPFNNLTLQLPIENLWSKSVFYFGLNKKPVTLDVEIDKNSSIKSLKELVAKKMGTETERLIMSEVYKYKFYKMFDNTSSIADCQISPNDDIAFFEVESVPTNYDPDKSPRSYFSFGRQSEKIPSFESPKADRLLVPVFNRVARSKNNSGRNVQRQVFGAPSYIIVNREEAFDYDAIFRKIAAVVDTMTTRDILNEPDILGDGDGEGNNNEDSDTVVMNEDDAESADSKVKTSSVDGEDGMVDVSMRDASDETDAATPSQDTEPDGAGLSKSSVASGLRKLFDVKFVKGGETVPTGFSSVDDNKEFPLMSSRIKAAQKAKRSEIEFANNNEKKGGNDSDQEGGTVSPSDSDGSDIFSSEKRPRVLKSDARPLVRPGEGIVLDWNAEAHDALFGGNIKDKNSLRGLPTWADVEHVADPELAKRRALRQTRKKKGVSLEECLDEFNKEEILSENDAWYCPRCKEHRRASKKFELWKTPDILVMHFKRFSASRGFRDKLDVFVDFPVEGLDMSGRVEAPEPGESLIYDLFAVDNHYGGLGGGHYTAYAKNFMSGEWNEYNGDFIFNACIYVGCKMANCLLDSCVSKALDPQSVVTSSAYLLFYRRRSDRPLGGKTLHDITASFRRAIDDPESQANSRAQSPSGEGRRLGGSSRNGSSSALAGVGAAHQAGVGGLRTAGTQAKNEDSRSSPPDYSQAANRQEGMLFDDEDDEIGGGVPTNNPLRTVNEPSWSFGQITEAHGPSQMTAAAPHRGLGPRFIDDDEESIDDAASNQAVGGDDMSDSELQVGSLLDDSVGGEGVALPGTPKEEDQEATPIQDVPPPLEADEEDELPVVELRVPDEDRIVSD